MPNILITIQGHDVIQNDDGSVSWSNCKADIDGDGSGGNLENDPDFQSTTSYRHSGDISVNARIEYGIVIPESMINLIGPKWLGSKCTATYNVKTVQAVVHDFGPPDKIGEITIALAQALGIPSSPISGGVDSGVDYKIWPGVPSFTSPIINYTCQSA